MLLTIPCRQEFEFVSAIVHPITIFIRNKKAIYHFLNMLVYVFKSIFVRLCTLHCVRLFRKIGEKNLSHMSNKQIQRRANLQSNKDGLKNNS